VKYVIETHPVDARRVYSTGFSNGGAVSVSLTRDHPELFAAISAMGWMVDMPDRNGVYAAYDMPFQVIQGTKEFTYATDSGAMAVMGDEQRGIRALMLFNEMIDESVKADYDATPYWGYRPDDIQTVVHENREWQVSNFYKKGYAAPFAQLVLIQGTDHRPNVYEATAAWDFFKHYARGENGAVIELHT
jgi:poly(3-hydroxybutyrate) depolymerase